MVNFIFHFYAIIVAFVILFLLILATQTSNGKSPTFENIISHNLNFIFRTVHRTEIHLTVYFSKRLKIENLSQSEINF